MLFFNRNLATPEENLAVEEAWLDMAEEGLASDEILRVWQPTTPMVVVGRGSRLSLEVDATAAAAARVPILRRVSGGAAIVAGPGCLMYAIMLSYDRRPHLRMLDQAHQAVMQAWLAALRPLEPRITWDGTCDLVVDARKVSGNSLRCRRDWMLYHGTLLLDMDLGLVNQFLLHPPREPEYRQGRPHADFVANLHIDAQALIANLCQAWAAEQREPTFPRDRIDRLVRERYSNSQWNFQR